MARTHVEMLPAYLGGAAFLGSVVYAAFQLEHSAFKDVFYIPMLGAVLGLLGLAAVRSKTSEELDDEAAKRWHKKHDDDPIVTEPDRDDRLLGNEPD